MSWKAIHPATKKKQETVPAAPVRRNKRRSFFAFLEEHEAALKITRLVRRFLFRRRLTWITVTGSVAFSKEHLRFIEDNREKCGMERALPKKPQRPALAATASTARPGPSVDFLEEWLMELSVQSAKEDAARREREEAEQAIKMVELFERKEEERKRAEASVALPSELDTDTLVQVPKATEKEENPPKPLPWRRRERPGTEGERPPSGDDPWRRNTNRADNVVSWRDRPERPPLLKTYINGSDWTEYLLDIEIKRNPNFRTVMCRQGNRCDRDLCGFAHDLKQLREKHCRPCGVGVGAFKKIPCTNGPNCHWHKLGRCTYSHEEKKHPPPSPTSSEASSAFTMRNDECVSCFEPGKNIMAQPCGHVVYCSACDPRKTGQKLVCPICRVPATFQQIHF